MDNENCELYFLIDPRTQQPFYVGIGKPGRSKVHVSRARKCTYVRLKDLKTIAIHKMLHDGVEPFDKIIASGLSKDVAKRREKQWIKKFGRIDLGTGFLTNRTSGGEWINDCPRDEEWRKHISVSQRIAQNRPETKRRKSQSLSGKKRSKQAVLNIQASQLRDDVRLKNSQSKRGDKNPAARCCIYKGKKYGAVIDVVRKTGLSRYFIKQDPTFSYL